MKNQQDNTNTLPALLRAADGVDTLETNSLCCAAAGITAPISVTAEALIPQEKLRGAALADATLNAQERPLAQPAVGCIAFLDSNPNRGGDSRSRTDSQIFLLNGGVKNSRGFCTPFELFDLLVVSTKGPQPLQHTDRFRKLLLNAENTGDHFIRKWLSQSTPKDSTTFPQSNGTVAVRHQGVPYIVGAFTQSKNGFVCSTLCQVSSARLGLLSRSPSTFNLPLMSIIGNHKCSNNRGNGTNRLYPGRSVIHRIKCLQNDKQCPSKRTNNQEHPNHPNTGGLHSRRSFNLHGRSLPLVISNLLRLPFSLVDVHGSEI